MPTGGLELLAELSAQEQPISIEEPIDANINVDGIDTTTPNQDDKNETPNYTAGVKTRSAKKKEIVSKKKDTPAAFDKNKSSTKSTPSRRKSNQPIDFVHDETDNVAYEHLSQPVDTPAKEKAKAEHGTLFTLAPDGEEKDEEEVEEVDEREDGDDGSHINNGDEEDDEYEYDMDEDQVSYVCQYVLSTLTNVYNLNSFLCY